jgi:hypothetical protein
VGLQIFKLLLLGGTIALSTLLISHCDDTKQLLDPLGMRTGHLTNVTSPYKHHLPTMAAVKYYMSSVTSSLAVRPVYMLCAHHHSIWGLDKEEAAKNQSDPRWK